MVPGPTGIRAVDPNSPDSTEFMPVANVKYGLESHTAGAVTTTYWTSQNRVYSAAGGSPTTLITIPSNICKGLKMIYP